MASIRKTPSGGYQATIYAGRDANGKQLFKYVTKKTMKECKSAAREIEQQLEDGKLTNVENIRVVAWIEQYLKNNSNSYAPGTIGLYKTYLKCHFEPFFKQLKLKDLNDLHISKFKNHLLGKMKASSARRVLGTLSKILKTALKDKSPAKEVELPKANTSCARAPSTEEFKLIHEAVAGTRYEIPVLCAGWCGFRREEIFAIKPDDLDFKDNTIRIDEAYAKNEKGQFQFGPPKSGNGVRTVKAPAHLMDLFKQVMSKEKVVSIDKENQPVLKLGRPDSFSSRYGQFIGRRKKHGVPDYRFHDLRHYHATWLQDNYFPDSYAASRMGQTKDVLRGTYQHLRPNKQKELDDRIEAQVFELDTKKTAK